MLTSAAEKRAGIDDSAHRPGAWRLSISALRFVLASVALGSAIYLARPILYSGVARFVRDMTVLTSPAGLVSGLRWQESLERFVLDSISLGVSVHIGSLSLAFILVVPAAFTWALPMSRRLRAVGFQLAACFVLGSTILAHDLLAIVSRTLESQGVSVFPPWRSDFYEGWINLGWDLAMIAVPAAACICALFPLLDARSEGRLEVSTRRFQSKRPAWLVPGLVGATTLCLVALDLGAGQRMTDEGGQKRFLLELAESDPDLPVYFLRRGISSLAAGRRRDAEAFLERAELFPDTRNRASRGLGQLGALQGERPPSR